MAVYSHSRLETFENCPLRYKFRYIDRLEKPDVQSVEGFVGTRVHEALESLYSGLMYGRQMTLEELVAEFRDEWEKNWTAGVFIVRKKYSPKDYRAFGEKCLRNYFAQYAPFHQSQTLSLEQDVTFALDPQGKYKLRGVIDRVARRADGTYEIHDYKTSRTPPPQAKADNDRQLGLYQIALRHIWTDVERVELHWHYLATRTTLRSRRTEQQLTQLAKTTMATIDRIERATDFPPKKSELCHWCEYRPECPAWTHPDAVAKLPAKKFKADEGVKLVDEFARLKSEQSELQTRIEVQRERLIAFARQHNFRVIRGSGCTVTVVLRRRESFPGKNEPGREELEALLRRHGKWDESSELDTHRLVRIVHDGLWSESLLKAVMQYMTSKETTEIRIHRGDGPAEDSE
jgi:putative RecB family exonuclease